MEGLTDGRTKGQREPQGGSRRGTERRRREGLGREWGAGVGMEGRGRKGRTEGGGKEGGRKEGGRGPGGKGMSHDRDSPSGLALAVLPDRSSHGRTGGRSFFPCFPCSLSTPRALGPALRADARSADPDRGPCVALPDSPCRVLNRDDA